eukprot:GEMP01035076.1.p2 GENE.GEMP01035076.1~~GEMP01035076.1.p2  ORF type:complete len:163 (-),score=37.42 GEMP01035076.1:262-750(-)
MNFAGWLLQDTLEMKESVLALWRNKCPRENLDIRVLYAANASVQNRTLCGNDKSEVKHVFRSAEILLVGWKCCAKMFLLVRVPLNRWAPLSSTAVGLFGGDALVMRPILFVADAYVRRPITGDAWGPVVNVRSSVSNSGELVPRSTSESLRGIVLCLAVALM